MSNSLGKITVAIADPADLPSLDEIRFILKCPVNVVMATEASIEKALERFYGGD